MTLIILAACLLRPPLLAVLPPHGPLPSQTPRGTQPTPRPEALQPRRAEAGPAGQTSLASSLVSQTPRTQPISRPAAPAHDSAAAPQKGQKLVLEIDERSLQIQHSQPLTSQPAPRHESPPPRRTEAGPAGQHSPLTSQTPHTQPIARPPAPESGTAAIQPGRPIAPMTSRGRDADSPLFDKFFQNPTSLFHQFFQKLIRQYLWAKEIAEEIFKNERKLMEKESSHRPYYAGAFRKFQEKPECAAARALWDGVKLGSDEITKDKHVQDQKIKQFASLMLQLLGSFESIPTQIADAIIDTNEIRGVEDLSAEERARIRAYKCILLEMLSQLQAS